MAILPFSMIGRNHSRRRGAGVLYGGPQVPLLRTQVYLTAKQRRRLDARRSREGKTLDAMIRDAIDAYLGKEEPADLRKTLDETFGIAPKFEVPGRHEWGHRGRRIRR